MENEEEELTRVDGSKVTTDVLATASENEEIRALQARVHELERELARLKGDVHEVAGNVEQPREREALERVAARGGRCCIHGCTPFGQWCRQCNPLRRS